MTTRETNGVELVTLCGEKSPGKGCRCERRKGHEGDHENAAWDVVWFGSIERSLSKRNSLAVELSTGRCPSTYDIGDSGQVVCCILEKGHKGDHRMGGGSTTVVWPDTTLESIVEQLLIALALPLESEHFAETPRRVADLFREFRQEVDLVALLKNGFEDTSTQGQGAMVVQVGIPFVGMCAHHLTPFQGRASVGYVPNKRIVGLSKLTRVMQAAGKIIPSTQEHITNLVADAIKDAIDPLGVMVVTEAEHGCMGARGVRTAGVLTKVSAIRGVFIHVPAARSEFLSLAGI